MARPRLLAASGMPAAHLWAGTSLADGILGRCSWVAEMLAGNSVEQGGLQAANNQSVVCDMLVRLDQPLRR